MIRRCRRRAIHPLPAPALARSVAARIRSEPYPLRLRVLGFWDLLLLRARGRFYEPVENRVDLEHCQQREYQDDEREEPEDPPVGQLLREGRHAVLEELTDRALANFDGFVRDLRSL